MLFKEFVISSTVLNLLSCLSHKLSSFRSFGRAELRIHNTEHLPPLFPSEPMASLSTRNQSINQVLPFPFTLQAPAKLINHRARRCHPLHISATLPPLLLMPLTSPSASWLPSTRQPETADLIVPHTYLEHSLVLNKDLQAAFPKVCSLEHRPPEALSGRGFHD